MSKVLFVVRGLPGSGKTTLANQISRNVFSADDYFTDPITGDYNFDPSKLKYAHQMCKDRTETYMQGGASPIAVANTFTQEWEMKEYFDLAEKYGYMVHTIIVENRHGGENIHNVPVEAMDRMRSRFQVELG